MSDIKSFKEHWKKTDCLPNGGQGTTIKAISLLDNSIHSVIKILNKQGDDERRKRIYRECAILETILHPNLPKVLDKNTEYWENKSYNLFIATEFIPGSTLSTFDFSAISLNEKIELTIKISQAIHYCHEEGVIHRDLKPDNIILKNNNIDNPIIIDFGLSFNFNENDNDHLTSEGYQLGNRFLILPEQKVGEVGKRDFRTDITHIVGLFYYFLTNQIPAVLFDEHNQKPHQRTKAKTIIDALPKHQKDRINYIFDIGFNQKIDRRWQTVKSFLLQLDLLKLAEPITMDTSEKFISEIKRKTTQGSYQDAKTNKALYDAIYRNVRIVLHDVRIQLGSDWDYSDAHVESNDMLGKSNNETVFMTKIFPVNTVNPKLRTNTIIHGFTTGNELVIQLIENNDKHEVFRQTLTSNLKNMNWTQFKSSLKIHYFSELARVSI